jgi:D-tyrosyl-tRNA(Tyr) deacylase
VIAVVQRVSTGRVEVAGRTVGEVGAGFVVLLGVARDDEVEQSRFLARKVTELRVFEDAAGKMNLDLRASGGGVLAVPQFTLLAGLRGGRRPDFLAAAGPGPARELFLDFVERLRQAGIPTQTGEFGATMQVHLVNQGPATFLLDTRELMTPRS